MPRQHQSKGVLFMLISAVGLSLAGLLGKIFEDFCGLTSLMFFRFFSSFLICLFVFQMLGKLKFALFKKAIIPNFLRSFFVVGAQYFFYYYVQNDSLLNGMALLNTGPLFIPFVEKLILKNKIPKIVWLSILICFTGVLLILRPDQDIFSKLSIIGILAGLFQACSQVVFSMNAKGENPEFSVLSTFGICSLITFLPFVFFGLGSLYKISHSNSLLYLIIGLGCSTLLNQLSRVKAYSFSTPSKLAAFIYFSVILAGFYDWIIYEIVPDFSSFLGVFLIISGGMLKVFFIKKDKFS